MSVASRLAGPLLGAIFVSGGSDAFRDPESKVKAAESVTRPMTERLDFLPEDSATLVQLNGAVQVAAGTALALGKFQRVAALALLGSLVPTTYAGHRFWEEEDEQTIAQQRIHFLKNLAVLGGLVLMAAQPIGAMKLSIGAMKLPSRVLDGIRG